MSMNFSEFKKLIGADPRNREAATTRARASDPEFESTAREAEEFEDKLEAALNIQPPADLLDEIKYISQQAARRRNWIPLAMAATLVIAVGAAGVVWKQARQWDTVGDYLADHYSHDGAELVAKAVEPVDKADVERILARFNTSATEQLASRIQFIKFCPTPDGRGAHMVINTEQGLMTLILMPHTDVSNGEVVEFDNMHALLVELGSGSAAIIGVQDQRVETLQAMVRQSLIMNDIGV